MWGGRPRPRRPPGPASLSSKEGEADEALGCGPGEPPYFRPSACHSSLLKRRYGFPQSAGQAFVRLAIPTVPADSRQSLKIKSMLKATIFREYDIRGIADSELLSPDVEQLVRGLGPYPRRHGGGANINLGRDCRLSSPRLRDALVPGLRAAGCNVTDIGTVPTPVLYHSAQNLNAHGAIMITGSDNASEYNGFKSVCGANTLHGDAIQEVLHIIQNGDFETGSGTLATADAVTPYVNEIAAQFKLDRRIKIVADAGNGTAGLVIHRIFQKMNVDATELFFEMDGHFPNHHPDPTVPSHLAHLI